MAGCGDGPHAGFGGVVTVGSENQKCQSARYQKGNRGQKKNPPIKPLSQSSSFGGARQSGSAHGTLGHNE